MRSSTKFPFWYTVLSSDPLKWFGFSSLVCQKISLSCIDIVLTRPEHFGHQFGLIQVFWVLGKGLENPFTTRFIFDSVRVVSGSVRILKLGTKKYVIWFSFGSSFDLVISGSSGN